MIRALIVDDDYRVARVHAGYVSRVDGFSTVGQAHTVDEAVRAVGELRPDLVLLDLYLPDGHGLELIRVLAEASTRKPDFIVITAARDVHSVRSAMQLGAVHYLVKPFGFPKLQERLIAYRDMQQRLGKIDEADQEDVDHLFALLRTPATVQLPKRHSAPTMARIRDAVRDAGEDISAAEAAALVGVSRPTAQRYLSYLAQQGIVELHLRYGTPGRPEQRYRMPRRSGDVR